MNQMFSITFGVVAFNCIVLYALDNRLPKFVGDAYLIIGSIAVVALLAVGYHLNLELCLILTLMWLLLIIASVI